MIDTDKYEGHTEGLWVFKHINSNWYQCDKIGEIHMEDIAIKEASANAQLIEDAPLLLEFIQKIVKEWNMPNKCNQEFGKDVRQLMYEYGLITFNEETRRYEVKE
jgi:hypothetical protein